MSSVQPLTELKIARSLPDAETLVNELQTFRVKASVAVAETLDAWRAFIDGKSAKDFTHDPLTGKWLAPSKP